MSKRCAIYVRVSSEQQAGEDKHSLESQEEACRVYAFKQGWQVLENHVYRDTHTGFELLERPAMTALRQAMRRSLFDTVLIFRLDRLARRERYRHVIEFDAEQGGVQIISVSEEDSNNELLRSFKGWMAEDERNKTRILTMQGRRDRIMRDKKLSGSGPPPYGYLYNEDRSRYVINEETQDIVEYIFRAAMNGESLSAISESLNRRGIPAPSDGKRLKKSNQIKRCKWSPTTVKYIINNPVYKGEAYHYKYRYEKDPVTRRTKKIIRPRDEWQLVEDAAPPYLSVGEWALAQQGVKNHNPYTREATVDRGHLFTASQQIVCGLCGRSLSRSFSKRKRVNRHGETKEYVYTTYSHHNQRVGEKCVKVARSSKTLDEIVWKKVTEALQDRERLMAHLRKAQEDDVLDEEIETHQRHLDKMRAEFSTMQQNVLLMADLLDPEVRQQQSTLLNAKKQAIEEARQEVEALQARQEALKQQQVDLDKVDRLLQALPKGMARATLEQRRLIVRAFQIKMTVYPTGHTPEWVLEGKLSPNTFDHVLLATSEDADDEHSDDRGGNVGGSGQTPSRRGLATPSDGIAIVGGYDATTSGRAFASSLDIIFRVTSENPDDMDVRIAA